MPTFDQESIESSIDDAVVDDYELPMPTFDQESIESMCCQVVIRTMPKSITSNTFANSIRLCISIAHTELLVREIHQQLFAEGFVEDPATARWQKAATALHVPHFYFGQFPFAKPVAPATCSLYDCACCEWPPRIVASLDAHSDRLAFAVELCS